MSKQGVAKKERFTFLEVAKLLRVHVSTVWRWHSIGAKGRRPESHLIGGRRFVSVDALSEFCGVEQKLDSEVLKRHEIAAAKLEARGMNEPKRKKNHE